MKAKSNPSGGKKSKMGKVQKRQEPSPAKLLEEVNTLRQRIQALEAKLAWQSQVEKVLRLLAASASLKSDQSAFRSLAQFLASALEADCTWIGEWKRAEDRVRTIAVCVNGTIGENFEYSPAGTPCQDVIGKEAGVYLEGIRRLFPSAYLLAPIEAEAYVGMPLFDSANQPIGVIAALYRYPLDESQAQQAKTILQMFGSCAAMKLERLRVEETLHESEERYRQLVELSPDGIGIHQEGRLVFINAAGARLFGAKEPSELLGKSVMELVHPDYHEVVQERIRTMREKQIPAPLIEEKFVRLDGTLVDVEVAATPILYRDQPAILVFVRGIQDRKRLEEQLRRSQKMESLGRLAGGLAHDFNNLLTSVLGFAELAEEQLPPEHPARPYLHYIQKAAEHAAGVIQQLLTFARRQSTEPRLISLNKLIGGLEKILQGLVGEAIELFIQLEPALWSIKADPNQIEQVILNLVVNARDAMPKGGKLTIETKNIALGKQEVSHPLGMATGEYVMLSIRDTGVGMPEEVKQRLFEPFFTTKEVGQGTGLGLAIVYGIVKQSGGEIEVESELGQGTTFRIFFPRSG